jgi:flavin-dependent dehydrogenase
MFDVLIVGARCAGSPLALLLARRGYQVAVLDAASFPSETLSTHLIWPAGVAALHRWGMWPAVAAGNPGICHRGLTSMAGGTLLGPWYPVDGVDYTVNIRRIKLDAMLVARAGEAGADVREGVVVDGLLRDGDRVVGVAGYVRKTRRRFTDHAAMVVGADGQRSTVAALVGAASDHVVPSLSVTYYRYVADLPGDRDLDEVYTCAPREYLFSPTDDGLTVVNLVMANELAPAFRQDVEGNFLRAFDLQPALAARLRAARPVERIRGVLNQPNFYRRSYGPGWALVGDAAYTKDPVRAQGISDAFIDAEALAGALSDGFSGRCDMTTALCAHERERRRRTAVPYEFCLRAARFEVPSPASMRRLMSLVEGSPAALPDMRGMIYGAIAPDRFYTPEYLALLLGGEAVEEARP